MMTFIPKQEKLNLQKQSLRLEKPLYRAYSRLGQEGKPVNPNSSADLAAVATILRRLVKPAAVNSWLHKRNPLLGLRTPFEAVREGRVQEVIEILARIEDGIHL